MAINTQEFLQGAAIIKLLKSTSGVYIKNLSDIHPSIYMVKTDLSESAILLKTSTKPNSAWSFSFSEQEEIAMKKLHQTHPKVTLFIALICHRDGVCCLSEKQLWTIIDPENGLINQRISVARKLNTSYNVTGTGRVALERKIPQTNWPNIILSSGN